MTEGRWRCQLDARGASPAATAALDFVVRSRTRRCAVNRLVALGLAACISSWPASAQAQWTPLVSPTTASLRGLSVIDGRTVWASGARGAVVHSNDGGNTLQLDSIPGAAAFDLRSIHARSATVAHVAATAGRIWRTTDGGTTWSLRYQATDTTVFLDAIDFWDDRHGIALGDPIGGRFFVLLTDDGGDTWREAAAESRPPAMEGEAAFAASGSSLAVQGSADSLVAWIGSGGRVARLHRSMTRMKEWVVYDAPIRQGGAAQGIFSVGLLPSGGLVIVGGDYTQNDSARANAAATRDGREWRPITNAAPRGYRSGVAFAAIAPAARRGAEVGVRVGVVVGVAVGPGGSDISRDGGMSWTPFDSVGYHAVRASRDGIFYSSGSDGRLARFDARARP